MNVFLSLFYSSVDLSFLYKSKNLSCLTDHGQNFEPEPSLLTLGVCIDRLTKVRVISFYIYQVL